MKSKKRAIILTLTLVLLIGGLVSATLAYFTDTEFNKDNVITIGNIEIDLYEHSADYETNDPTGLDLQANDTAYRDVYLKETNKNILPGQNVNKYTYINNTGENAAFVRFVVTVPAGIDGFLTYTWNTVDYKVTRVVEGANVVYYCVGREALAAKTLSEPGLINVAINPDLNEKDLVSPEFAGVFADGTRNFNITVAAHAIQTVGFGDAAAAFEAFDANQDNAFDNEKVQP